MPTLGNMTAMSFFPTDEKIVNKLTEIIVNPRQGGFVADFQAGKGDALLTLASALKMKPVANELEPGRYAILKAGWKANPNHLKNADAQELKVSSRSLSLLFCNPPYQDIDGGNGYYSVRTEVKHAEAHIGAVSKGGLFVLVCYQHHLPGLSTLISRYLTDVNIYRASENAHLDKYTQIVIIGEVKRVADPAKNRIPQLNGTTSQMESWFRSVSRTLDVFPLLQNEKEGAYTINCSPYPEQNFVLEAKSPYQLLMQHSELLDTKPSPMKIKPTVPPKPEAITQPRIAHLASLMASGILNGTVIDVEGRSVLLSLTTRIETRTGEKEPTDNGWTRTTTEVFIPIITLWDTVSSEIQYITEIEEIQEFITEYRDVILLGARQKIKTLYNTGDWRNLYPDLEHLAIYGNGKPVKFFEGQIETIAGTVEALKKRSSMILSGEQGIGKSLIGGAVIYKSDVPADKWVLIVNPPALASQTEDELQRLVDPKTNRLPDGRKLNLVKIVSTNKEGEKAVQQFMSAIRELDEKVRDARRAKKPLPKQLNVMIVKLSALKLNNGYSAGVKVRDFGDVPNLGWLKRVVFPRIQARVGTEYYPITKDMMGVPSIDEKVAKPLKAMRDEVYVLRRMGDRYSDQNAPDLSRVRQKYGIETLDQRDEIAARLNREISDEEHLRRVSHMAYDLIQSPVQYHEYHKAGTKHTTDLRCPKCSGIVWITKHNDDYSAMQDALERKGASGADGIICESKVCNNCGQGFEGDKCLSCSRKGIETTYHICNERLVQQNHFEKPRDKAHKVNPVFWSRDELFGVDGSPTPKFASYMASNDGHAPTRVEISRLIKKFSDHFVLAVLDEAHMIRNTETAQSAAMFQAVSRIKKRLLMSGTPFNGLASSVRNAMLVTDSELWKAFKPSKNPDGTTNWKETVEKFIEEYGAKKTVETYTESNGKGNSRSKKTSGNVTKVVSEAPGVTPALLALGVRGMLTVGIHDIRNDMPSLNVKFEPVSIKEMTWYNSYKKLERDMKRAAGAGDKFLGLFMTAYFSCVNPHAQIDTSDDLPVAWADDVDPTAQELWLDKYIKEHNFDKQGRITIMMHQTSTKDHRKRIADALIAARPELAGRIAMLNGNTDTRSEDIRRIWEKGNLIMITNIEKVGLGQNITQSPTIIMLEPAMGSIQFSQSARRAYRISQMADCKVIVLFVQESVVHNALVDGVLAKLKAMARMSGYVDQTIDSVLAGHDPNAMDGIGQIMKMISEGKEIVADVPAEAVDISGRNVSAKTEQVTEEMVAEETQVAESFVENLQEIEPDLPLEQPEQVQWVYSIPSNVRDILISLPNNPTGTIRVQVVVGKAKLFINRFYQKEGNRIIAGTVVTSTGRHHGFAVSNDKFKKLMDLLKDKNLPFAAMPVEMPLAVIEKQYGEPTNEPIQSGWFN